MLGSDIDPDLRIQSLSRTEKSLVAIARALAAKAEILVLDEPTASLPADEVARLFTALRRLRARSKSAKLANQFCVERNDVHSDRRKSSRRESMVLARHRYRSTSRNTDNDKCFLS
jgi:ABC-type branched-subunit amino acid transport system ATPase component